jgi:mRNA interferase MazF
MKEAGQIVLTPFPYTDLSGAKLRPVMMLRQSPRFDDWLVRCTSSCVARAPERIGVVLARVLHGARNPISLADEGGLPG